MLYTKYVSNYTDKTGEQPPAMYGWWIINTDGTEHWDVDGPFTSQEEAETAKAAIEQELEGEQS